MDKRTFTRQRNIWEEYLRDIFFAQDGECDRGCYTVFKTRDYIKKLESISIGTADWQESWDHFKIDTEFDSHNVFGTTIFMSYHWDGDGTLIFYLPGIGLLVNDDCKKTFGWEYYSDYNSIKEYLEDEI